MMHLFYELSRQCSKAATEQYSTSFSSAIRLLHGSLHAPIYSIYGFVRLADEIVDSFPAQDKKTLLEEYKTDTFHSIERGLSTNPILHSFQQTVHQYQINMELIHSFFYSMEMDLHQQQYHLENYKKYIYGSAEVVGLMCLYVFCEGDTALFHRLQPYAQSLGAAFQKVNFLRDIHADNTLLGRSYFPGIDFNNFTVVNKKKIEAEIEIDFKNAYKGIVCLPYKARFGVYVAYNYYYSLFKKIQRAKPSTLLRTRFSIPPYGKAMILAKASLRQQLNIL